MSDEAGVTRQRPATVLTIAGSDPSGGAGIQGDLRTFAAHGVHGFSVITSVIAQGSRGVRGTLPVAPSMVRAQIDAIAEDFTVDAIKIGALATGENASVVADALALLGDVPVVLDTALASSSGAALLDARGIEVMRDRLIPRATLVTPNAIELARLLDEASAPSDEHALAALAERLLARGARAVLAKGGHLVGAPIDLLITPHERGRWASMRIDSPATRGTGCALSSSIAASLARGRSLPDSVDHAIGWVHRAIAAGVAMGPGESPLAHLFGGAPRLPEVP